MQTSLIIKTKENYGSEHQNHLFEQYKLYVESVEKISDRRLHANNFFLTLCSGLITVWGFVNFTATASGNEIARTALCSIGVLTCIIWLFTIRSYRQINTGKFQVIHKIEQELPLSLYAYEWQVLGEGIDNKKYFPFSHLEIHVPKVIGFSFVLLGIATWIL